MVRDAGEGTAVVDVTAEVASTPTAPLLADPAVASGAARVVTSTVVAGPDGGHAWVLAELASGERTLVASAEPVVVEAFTAASLVGESIVAEGASFRLA